MPSDAPVATTTITTAAAARSMTLEIAQRDVRIDARRATGRQVTGDDRSDDERDRDERERDRIEDGDGTRDHQPEDAAADRAADQAQHEPGHHRTSAVHENHAHQALGGRA